MGGGRTGWSGFLFSEPKSEGDLALRFPKRSLDQLSEDIPAEVGNFSYFDKLSKNIFPELLQEMRSSDFLEEKYLEEFKRPDYRSILGLTGNESNEAVMSTIEKHLVQSGITNKEKQKLLLLFLNQRKIGWAHNIGDKIPQFLSKIFSKNGNYFMKDNQLSLRHQKKDDSVRLIFIISVYYIPRVPRAPDATTVKVGKFSAVLQIDHNNHVSHTMQLIFSHEHVPEVKETLEEMLTGYKAPFEAKRWRQRQWGMAVGLLGGCGLSLIFHPAFLIMALGTLVGFYVADVLWDRTYPPEQFAMPTLELLPALPQSRRPTMDLQIEKRPEPSAEPYRPGVSLEVLHIHEGSSLSLLKQ